MDIKHYVYFISDGEYVKIGIAGDIQSRLAGLQSGNPKPLHLLHSIECVDRIQAMALEKILHRYFGVYRMVGEWFSITKENIQSAPLKQFQDDSRLATIAKEGVDWDTFTEEFAECLQVVQNADDISQEQKAAFFALCRAEIALIKAKKRYKDTRVKEL